MPLLDSRRLTGPNLLLDGPGAALEVDVAPFDPGAAEAVAALWREGARRLVEAVGWGGERLAARRHAKGLSLALSAPLVSAPLVVLVPSLVVAAALAMSWNGLAFTAAAELAGRARSGTALGFQQTSLSIAGTVAPIAFAAVVDAASWRTGFAVAAVLPLGGAVALARLDESRPGMMQRCGL